MYIAHVMEWVRFICHNQGYDCRFSLESMEQKPKFRERERWSQIVKGCIMMYIKLIDGTYKVILACCYRCAQFLHYLRACFLPKNNIFYQRYGAEWGLRIIDNIVEQFGNAFILLFWCGHLFQNNGLKIGPNCCWQCFSRSTM